MTYQIETILTALSHLQGHSYCKLFKCVFYPHDAMLAQYLLSHVSFCPSVCHKLEFNQNC